MWSTLFKIKNFIVSNYLKIILISLCSLLVFLLFYGFPDSPSPWFDEGINIMIAKSFAEKGVFNMAVGPNQYVNEKQLMITTNYPLLLPVFLAFKLLGTGLWQAKIIMILYLVLFVFLVYRLVKKNYGEKQALMSLALLIVFLPLYGNGKSVLGEIPGLVFILSGLLFLDKEKKWQVILTGLFFGLGAATKPLYLLFVLSLLACEVFFTAKQRKINFSRLFFLSLGGFIPLLVWFLTIIPTKLDLVSIYNFFVYYRNPYNVDAGATIGKNLIRFVTESTPVHFLLLFIAFVISKIIERRFKKMETVLLFFILLDLFFYVKTAGWYRYFFPAHILLFILFPHALLVVTGKIKNKYIRKYGAVLIIGFLFFVQSFNLLSNINSKLYYNPQPRHLGEVINKIIPLDKNILVVHNPALAFFIKSDNVWQYLTINPYLTSGNEWFTDGSFPDYLVMGPGSEMLLKDEKVLKAYRLILEEGKLSLFKKRQ